MSTVLITGARAPIARDLGRSFQDAGWTVHLADCLHSWRVRFSQGPPFHRYASPRYAFETFCADLSALIHRLDPQWILPTCEEVFYVAAAGARLGIADRVFAPPLSILRQLHSKVDFAALAQHCGLAAPQTRRATSASDLAVWRSRSSQLVFKPEFSRFASAVLVKPDGIDHLTATTEYPWAVQDFVAGEELCLWSAAIKGEMVAFAAYKPLWRRGRSSSFYFETDRDPALLSVARAIAKETHATGQISIDAIRRVDGTIAPIECNPRGISGIHLFDADPRLARAMVGENALALPTGAARHIAIAMWLFGAPQALAEGRFGEFRRDLARSRDVLSLSGEPFIVPGALLDAGLLAITGLWSGRSASRQSTSDIEWNGEPIG